MASLKKTSLGGQKFGRLRAIASPFKTVSGVAVNTQCDCGAEKIILVENLLSGRTRSCGCLSKEVSRLLSQFDENGDLKPSAQPEYKAYRSAMQRCLNPKATKYASCGGAGIKFHEPWIGDFPAFYRDLGPAKRGQILTRKNLRADFTPENCFWGSWGDVGVSTSGLRRSAKLSALPEAA